MEPMRIVYRPLDSLKPYEKNPRKIGKAVNYVMNSIKEFGFLVPVVIDSNGVIVCGHVRYTAAKKMKLTEIPCVIADDLTEAQIQAFRVVDNKTQELSTWDFAKLIAELDEITSDVNMQAFGFNANTESKEKKEKTDSNLDEGEELDLEDFDDERFTCTCPCCGFKFND